MPVRRLATQVPYRDPEAVEPSASGLVPVGVQRGYDDDRHGARNNPDAERHVAELLAAYRRAGLPVVHVGRETVEPGSPFHPNRPGVAFKPAAAPADDEPVVTDRGGGVFLGTDLESRLRTAGVERPVLVGFTTDRRVSTAARTASALGFDPYVVDDATVAFDRELDGTRYVAEQTHRVALAQLSGAAATVVETATLLAALERRA